MLPLFLLVATYSGDWPQLRGPDHDGHAAATPLLQNWPADGPPVVWSRTLGQGYSSFAVVGSRAWTQYQTLTGQAVICLDARTGDTLWESRYALPYEAVGIYPGPRSTPVWHKGKVYYCGTDGEVGCLDSETGHRLWLVPVQRNLRGTGTDFGYSASPLVIRNRVILPIGGPGASVVALDAVSGKTVWHTGDDSASYCTILPIRLDGEDLLVAYLENVLAVLHFEDGRWLWRSELSAGYDEHSAQPIYREPFLMVAAPFKAGARQLKLTPVRDDTGRMVSLRSREVWNNREFSNDVVSSTLTGECVYGFDLRDAQSKAHRPSRGAFRCLDWTTGKERWSTDRVGQAMPIVVGETVVLFSDNGELIVARHDPDQYAEIGRAVLFRDEVCWTSPALADGRLYVRTQTRALCLDLRRPVSGKAHAGTPIDRMSPETAFAGQWDWVLNGEREHPFMLPPLEELSRWFWVSFFAAILPASFVPLAVRRPENASVRGTLQAGVFAAVAVVLGIVATPIANRYLPEFTFTWPAALYGVLMLAAVASARASPPEGPASPEAHRTARQTGLLFLGTSAVYFFALRRFSLPHEWVFLLGNVAAAVIVVPAARQTVRQGWTWKTSLLSLAGYGVFFWSCGVLELLRDRWSEFSAAG